jgi:hypothetical protein
MPSASTSEVVHRVAGWIIDDLTWGGVALGIFLILLTGVASLLAVSLLLVKLPATYLQDYHSRDVWSDRHPALRLTARTGKNLLGALLIALGALLSLPGVPGPGVLTIVVGLVLLDLPGKRRLERRLVGRPRILRAINRLRKRFGSPPLVLGSRRGQVRRRRLSPSVGGPGRDPAA